MFEYPCESGSTYYQIYSEHLNFVNVCSLSPDGNFLLTSSSTDKAVFIWRIYKEFTEEDEEPENLESDEEEEERGALLS